MNIFLLYTFQLTLVRTILLAGTLFSCAYAQSALASDSQGFPNAAPHSTFTASPTSQDLHATSNGLALGGWDNRYLKYNGTFPYFVGMDAQSFVSNTRLDYRRALDLLAYYDINKIRVWLNPAWYPPGESGIAYPWAVKVDESDSNPWRAFFCFFTCPTTGKFDLYTWDSAFWTRLQNIVAYAQDKGIIVEITLFTIQGPDAYFSGTRKHFYAFRNVNNIQNFGKPNPNGLFLPQFFDLGYAENGISLQSLQRKLIDKTLDSVGAYGNVYLELDNEGPGDYTMDADNDCTLIYASQYAPWTNALASYIKSKSTKFVAVHPNGQMDISSKKGCSIPSQQRATARFSSKPDIDILNFHLYASDPDRVSAFLHSSQLAGKVLSTNEGRSFKSVAGLNHEIRYGWGMMTGGGYYSIYNGTPTPSSDVSPWHEAARFLQGMRNIVESIPDWQEMSPVRPDGTEYDNLVSQGTSAGWQVIANEGASYLVYSWGHQKSGYLKIHLSPGTYHYTWYDARAWNPPLLTGTVTGKTGATIPAPPQRDWDAESGVVLTIVAEGPDDQASE